MQFRIADTFQANLTRLTNQEQKAVKITVFDLQAHPSSPGLKFHKLDRAKDAKFWSVRVNRDIRFIVHWTSNSILITYVGHHNDAYAWAERRRIEARPRTGAAQLVVVREAVEEVAAALLPAVHRKPIEPLLFEDHPGDDELLGFGIPEEWLSDVRNATESCLFDLFEHLPQEAAESLLERDTGGTPVVPDVVVDDPFLHPDAQRRFRVMENVEELKKALEYAWEKWTIFLHPSQRRYAERSFNGPARVGGTASTGKTVVALHRVHWLARSNPDHQVLLTTFSPFLAANLSQKLDRLVADASVRGRIVVDVLSGVAAEMYRETGGSSAVANDQDVMVVIDELQREIGGGIDVRFLKLEWDEVVDALGLTTREAYRDVPRLGRKTRLGVNQRKTLWGIFERTRARLKQRGLITETMVYAAVADACDCNERFQHFVVDDAQELGVAEQRVVQSLAGQQMDGLFFAGDSGQRIFRLPFSWKSQGVDIRGSSFTPKINYRTTEPIRRQADRLLLAAAKDIDGKEEDRRGAVSLFDEVPSVIERSDAVAEEVAAVAAWIRSIIQAGTNPQEVGLFVRSEAKLPRAQEAAKAAGLSWKEPSCSKPGCLVIATMFLAKGLEFRAVAVMACDDEVIPDQDRIETETDEANLMEVYESERHLLYVSITRSRDYLFVSGVEPVSEFLDDLVELNESLIQGVRFNYKLKRCPTRILLS